MIRLSVNVNKIATLRNARGHDVPNLSKVVQDCEHFGAQGITVHPRPDERHIKYQDVFDLKSIVKTDICCTRRHHSLSKGVVSMKTN